MEFEFIYEPVQLIIVKDVFTKKENEEILAEAISNEKEFVPAETNGTNSIKNIRNNISCYYDELYSKDRTKSKLLEAINGCFGNPEIAEIFSSFTHPINLITETNNHETVMGRYGDEGQEYKYHADTNGSDGRLISIVFYFNKEPKEYEGGEIQFTRSPVHSGIAVDKNQTPINITPENNMMVVFGSKVAHRVLPTTSPKTFDSGRFSVNCWIGKKG